MMKKGVRILALEDSPFSKKGGKALIIGLVGRDNIVEGMLSFGVDVDGSDSTEMILRSLRRSRFLKQVRVIALNGITLAGLNIVDVRRLSDELGVSIVAITRKKPHARMLSVAIGKRGLDVAGKRAMLKSLWSGIELKRTQGYYVQYLAGVETPSEELVRVSAGMLRLAHIVASGLGRGESSGRV